MIPVEVTLRNFMCYDDNEGEPFRFNFRDHRLWSICGDNGAGKSAIFDAITYTLFGRHRGGERRDEELIRKGANEMACSFSFEHYSRLFRVTRTIKRKVKRSGEVAFDRACELDWFDTDSGAWREVSGSSTVTGLEDYVRTSLLGFDYDTFISSVLLLQGESDKLLRSKASDRFNYLSGILDLRRYARLEKIAWSRAKTFRDQHQLMADSLQELGIPSEEEVQKAAAKSVELNLAATKVEVQLKAADDRLARVMSFWDRSSRSALYETQAKDMEDALAHGAEIRADGAEKRVLTDAMPRLNDAVTALAAALSADGDAKKALDKSALIDQEGFAQAVLAAESIHNTARSKHEAKSAEMRKAREEQNKLASALALAQQLREFDSNIHRAEAEAEKLETETRDLEALRARRDRLELLHRTHPLITGYGASRKRQAEVLATFGEATATDALGAAQDARAQAELEIDQSRLKLAGQQELVGKLHGELSVAKGALKQREDAGSEGTCSHCGQVVSAAHIRKEISRARTEVAQLEAADESGTSQLKALAGQVDQLTARVRTLREEEQRIRQRVEALNQALARAAEIAGDRSWEEVPIDIKAALDGAPMAVETALRTVTTELEGLVDLRAEVLGLAGKDADLRSQRSLIAGWLVEKQLLLAQITPEQAERALAQKTEVDRYFAEAEPVEATLGEAVELAFSQVETARTKLVEATTEKSELVATAKVLGATAYGQRAAAAAAVRGLDERFLPASKEKIEQAQRRLLELAKAEEKLSVLEAAATELIGLQGQIREINEQLSQVPDTDRITIDMANEAVATAKAEHASAVDAARSSRDVSVTLSKQREERLAVQKQVDDLTAAHRIWDRLAKMLGRSGLQLTLMKRDLAEIERLTNVMLTTISGGMLQLSIEFLQGRGGEEIVFRCIDGASSEDALDVAFLSGGQRFRVAVALAAGIGQYAGLGASMPSQIIDEGFGSLDEKGRREMLEQIREMSEHFERIIVVSHTESFHDPALFPARYELRKDGRRTLVSRAV